MSAERWLSVAPGVSSVYIGDRIDDEVRAAMRDRCEADSHCYENCCSVMFQTYQRCKWCGGTSNVRPSPFLRSPL